MTSKVKYFDIDNLEVQWSSLSNAQQILIVEQSAHLPPEQGIVPALKGFASTDPRVQALSGSVLKALTAQARSDVRPKQAASPSPRQLRTSAGIAAQIYSQIASLPDDRNKLFLFRLLADMDGMGPGTAFTALVRGHICIESLQRTVRDISEPGRLSLTGHYLQAPPEIRLELAPLFKKILGTLQTRAGVLTFFADLFDRGRDTDPFLYNISPTLRDPQSVLEKELVSTDLQRKILGLKALSMMVNTIPSARLRDLLTPDESPGVRTVIYQIVENATPGTYAELFDAILDLIPDMEPTEAHRALRALAGSGRHPVHHLLDIIHTLYPDLLPAIREEAANLSKTGFLFIQDMALHPDRYRSGIHLDINLACIFGMIKKRPERVAALLEAIIRKNRLSSTPEITRFLDRIKHLLDLEKRDIASAFLTENSKPPAGGENSPGTTEDSLQDRIQGKDFSNGRFQGETGFRNKRIDQCLFAGAEIKDTPFNRSTITGTDFSGAVFDSVSFEQCLWININARNATFRNCRFDTSRICNTDLTNATIIDSFFTAADLAGTDVRNAQISFTSFAFSRLSGIRLDTARTDGLDFSGASARFSRFPPEERRAAPIKDVDYNARKFQLVMTEVPPLWAEAIAQINMLIFCEFAHYGEMKFTRKNKLSLLTALDIFRPEQNDLFSLIPALLHENLDFPLMGTVSEETPCGIADYRPSPHALALVASLSEHQPPDSSIHTSPAILGLYTIGSVGSVAQTSQSDIDYWVCIREAGLQPNGRDLLETKLSLLEEMARGHFHTQVTFFIVDIDRVKANDFGDSTMESSGSAQAGLLKEEFYRTMIYLAGKIPLWAVLPTAISRRHYPSVAKRLSPPTADCRYLDLGDIHGISSGEYFGASVWQMFKWIKSPFKSILKMALLEKYFFEPKDSPLLCNQYKTEWMNTGARLKLAQNDAYFFLMRHLIRFYKDQKDPHSVNLLLTCFFLKLEVSGSDTNDRSPFGIHRVLLDKCLDAWGWDIKKAESVGSIRTWPYTNIVRLSRSLEAYILKKYKRVTTACREMGILETLISPQDKTVLEHKVKIEFSRQPMKVRKVLLVSRGDQHFSRLYLRCRETCPPGGKWELINQALDHDRPDDLIYQADTIEEIGAWLVVNDLFSEQTRIRLLSSPFPVTEKDIRDLFTGLLNFFSPRLKQAVPFEHLLAYPRKTAVFSSVNFYAPRGGRVVSHYTTLYINGWNEIFCQSGHAPRGYISMAHVKRDMALRLRMAKLPEDTEIFRPQPQTQQSFMPGK